MKSMAKDSPPFSHAEYDALPIQVQRKYFSSLERLRIAEQQSSRERQHDWSRRSSHSRAHSFALARSLTLSSTRRRLRKAESLRIEHQVSLHDVEFFLSLPEKVRKQHFSREEQVLLLGRCHQPPLAHDFDSARTREPSDEFQNFNFGFYDDSDTEGIPERGRSRRRSRSVSPRRLSFNDEQDTNPPPLSRRSLQYIDTMAPPVSYQSVPPQTSPFRRTMSLTNTPVRHSTSSAPLMSDPPLFTVNAPLWHQRSTSLSISGRRSSHTPTAPVFDPEATHYRDPEARKKLRMFLASPQKFDEAVEFGFPSTAGNDTAAPRYQLPPITTDAQNFSRDMQTFLRDDRVSFLDEDDHAKSDTDGESATDVDSPITPSSTGMSFRCHTRHVSPSTFGSLDSTGFPPMHPMGGRLNREMTLRMTLTRSDLRADEEQLYGWQAPPKGAKDDPFALEDLTFSDDMTGAKGAFAVKPKPHGNLVSRLFKRSSKKSR